MEFDFKTGAKGHKETTVTEDDTAKKIGSGLLDVFSTPSLVALMESTAQSSISDVLPCGYGTVGIEMNVKHIKATPVGMKVRCESVLTEVDRRKLTFKIEAYDEAGKIGEAVHSRFVIENEKFLKKISR